jgi:hypothetical protein
MRQKKKTEMAVFNNPGIDMTGKNGFCIPEKPIPGPPGTGSLTKS